MPRARSAARRPGSAGRAGPCGSRTAWCRSDRCPTAGPARWPTAPRGTPRFDDAARGAPDGRDRSVARSGASRWPRRAMAGRLPARRSSRAPGWQWSAGRSARPRHGRARLRRRGRPRPGRRASRSGLAEQSASASSSHDEPGTSARPSADLSGDSPATAAATRPASLLRYDGRRSDPCRMRPSGRLRSPPGGACSLPFRGATEFEDCRCRPPRAAGHQRPRSSAG